LQVLARLRRVVGILRGQTRTGPSALEELGGSLETLQRNLTARLDEGHEQLLRVRDAVSGLRLVPAASVLSTLQRGVRDAAQIVRLILQGGVTTTKAVTQVSGRGIGLDVLRETAAHLKGDVRVLTEAGVGTTVEVCVPVSLSLLSALAVDAAGVALLPLDAVRETLRVTEQDVARSADGDHIIYQGGPVPFLSLAEALGRPAASHPP